MPGFLTADIVPVHLDKATVRDKRAHQGSFVDLALLANATCFARSHSGFSALAWLAGGGKPCHRAYHDDSCTDVEPSPHEVEPL